MPDLTPIINSGSFGIALYLMYLIMRSQLRAFRSEMATEREFCWRRHLELMEELKVQTVAVRKLAEMLKSWGA